MITFSPKRCAYCPRMATLAYVDDDEPWACDECGTACGEECCGVFYWSPYPVWFDVVELAALEDRSFAQDVEAFQEALAAW